MTQCEMILRYLKENGKITSYTALIDLGIYRLASRIHDLTKQGYVFNRKQMKGTNRYGAPTHWVEYSLLEEQPKTNHNSITEELAKLDEMEWGNA